MLLNPVDVLTDCLFIHSKSDSDGAIRLARFETHEYLIQQFFDSISGCQRRLMKRRLILEIVLTFRPEVLTISHTKYKGVSL